MARNLTILSLITAVISTIGSVVAVVLLLTGSFRDNPEANYRGVLILVIIIVVICLVLGIYCLYATAKLKMDLAEYFSYPRGLGILWLFIPLVGHICCIVNSDKYYCDDYSSYNE